MPGKEIDHRSQHRRVAQPTAQGVGGEPGQRQQPLGAGAVGKHPAERRQRQSLRIRSNGSFTNDCQGLPGSILIWRWIGLAEASVAKRILVVEDNDLNRKLFCDLLKANGFAVEPVADGREAIERARLFVPNLVIMDIQLPNISGLELIEALKADNTLRSIPVLAVTAYAGKGDEERIREAGAEGYLAKPVSIGPFMVAVKALV